MQLVWGVVGDQVADDGAGHPGALRRWAGDPQGASAQVGRHRHPGHGAIGGLQGLGPLQPRVGHVRVGGRDDDGRWQLADAQTCAEEVGVLGPPLPQPRVTLLRARQQRRQVRVDGAADALLLGAQALQLGLFPLQRGGVGRLRLPKALAVAAELEQPAGDGGEGGDTGYGQHGDGHRPVAADAAVDAAHDQHAGQREQHLQPAHRRRSAVGRRCGQLDRTLRQWLLDARHAVEEDGPTHRSSRSFCRRWGDPSAGWGCGERERPEGEPRCSRFLPADV